jgi:FAD/FMN-containing dehydrogenase
MRTIEWHDSKYALQSCNITLDGSFVKAGSGNQMRQLYHAATDRKLMIVGGDSATVSLGGYISGGGHSVLSPWLGMAADQVVELEIVTADGNLIVANECSNPDIFWAARGVCAILSQIDINSANNVCRAVAQRLELLHL